MTVNELLTVASIISAIVLATAGWYVVKAHEEEERERIAKADAVTLYRKLSVASTQSLKFLLTITGPQMGNLLKFFPEPIVQEQRVLVNFYDWLQARIAEVLEGLEVLPSTEQCYDDLRAVYKIDTEFADHFIRAILSITALKLTMNTFVGYKPLHRARIFANQRSLQISNFLLLIVQTAKVSLRLERCREELGIDRGDEFQMSDVAFLSERFYEALGVENPFIGETMTTEEYVKLFETIEMIFNLEFAKHRTGIHSE